MRKLWFIALFLLLLGVISACSNDEPANSDEKAGTEESADTEESSGSEDTDSGGAASTELAGNDVFQKSCITCHSSGDITGGQAKLDGAKIHTDFKTQEDLLAFVEKNMPKNAPGSLSKDEYEAVVKYLWNQK
nr:cytochrome c [Neobacillus sp. Marseille-Q6967]